MVIGTKNVVVAAKRQVAESTFEFDLKDVAGLALPAWEPGAHVAVSVPGGERQYSLCGDPADPATYTIAVLRQGDGRGGSVHLCDNVHEGDVLAARDPLNHFVLSPSPRYLFIAGGIGITPVLAMMRHARASGAELAVAYGGRRVGSMAYVDEVRKVAPDALIWPEEEHGQPRLKELLRAHPDVPVYCCGPEGLLAALEGACAANGREAPHVERFSPIVRTDAEVDLPFTLVLAKSGEAYQVPADRSALDVLTDAGADVFGSCLEGTCGSCEVGVLEGVPDHRDVVLTPEMQAENDCMMPCVSRARTDRLVIDL